MFIEVYSDEDKEKMLQQGYKLLKSIRIENCTKYVFANTDKLKFDNSEVKCNFTNRLTF